MRFKFCDATVFLDKVEGCDQSIPWLKLCVDLKALESAIGPGP